MIFVNLSIRASHHHFNMLLQSPVPANQRNTVALACSLTQITGFDTPPPSLHCTPDVWQDDQAHYTDVFLPPQGWSTLCGVCIVASTGILGTLHWRNILQFKHCLFSFWHNLSDSLHILSEMCDSWVY